MRAQSHYRRSRARARNRRNGVPRDWLTREPSALRMRTVSTHVFCCVDARCDFSIAATGLQVKQNTVLPTIVTLETFFV